MNKVSKAQELADRLTGQPLANALFDELHRLYDESPEKAKSFLGEEVFATVWHGTRRTESIQELKQNGFCSYTPEQSIDWLIEASKLICEKMPKASCKTMDRSLANIIYEISESNRGKFFVTTLEDSVCGTTDKVDSGWADRNPEFVWDYLYWNSGTKPKTGAKVVSEILNELFGKPVKVKLRVKTKVNDLLSPNDIHLKQRCFKPEEIIDIVPCPEKVGSK